LQQIHEILSAPLNYESVDIEILHFTPIPLFGSGGEDLHVHIVVEGVIKTMDDNRRAEISPKLHYRSSMVILLYLNRIFSSL
jgi:hypothetical protein